ncbi:MAG: DUF441 domain-containing protein [Bacillaceae bacterium]|uniref:UPF0756 membrane protein N7Z68_02965 n=1 Tax=Alkalihalobacterium chitinilyticum TaxID=2980103 RepID=A0ABT5VA45_9BACI|nr:DUF441 domain-containing protein [Alkalihalobacterium chitinilyticum]MDE5412331.1 DUF441 domain-containing protein [Alkalihalobacterium chitinilyticum]MEB1807766.1 DUF441 domain-containing protein [Bacillaceae bacterium]
MLSQSSLFLLILLVISWLGKNQSLLVAVVALLLLKWTGLGDKLFPLIQAKGINWGVTILTIAVLVPIATGEIGFKQLTESLKSSYAWIALFSGIAVALIAASGVDLLKDDPHITTALVLGTILAVVLFKGIAVGPLIAAGIAYLIIQLISIFTTNGG